MKQGVLKKVLVVVAVLIFLCALFWFVVVDWLIKMVIESQGTKAVGARVDVASADNTDAIKDALVRQLHNPVRWVETIQSMASQGVNKLIECGPGKVLVGLNKRIARDMTALPVIDSETLNAALADE